MTRRVWLQQMIGGASAILLGACSEPPISPSPQQSPPPPPPPPPAPLNSARLAARPHTTSTGFAPGTHALGLGGSRDGLLHVPLGYKVETPVPLIVLLHGLGGHVGELNKTEVMPMTAETADRSGVALLFPESRGSGGWDRSLGNFGPDIAFIDAALTQTFNRLNVSPTRIAVWGFSDGASYSLSMGLCNGDLFSHVAAFSPEYMSAPEPTGQPGVFVSHGRSDPFIPVATSRDGLVPDLRNRGYAVDYVEFDGGHFIDPGARTQALAAFLG
jgi:phospholipase/carboxylesterase